MSAKSEAKAARFQKVINLSEHGFSAPEVAAMFGITSRTVERYRREAGLIVGKGAKADWKLRLHGVNGYQYHRCRCEICVTAHRARMMEGRRDRIRRGLPDGDPRHGTSNGYMNWDCRCEPCKTAGAQRQRATRQARAS